MKNSITGVAIPLALALSDTARAQVVTPAPLPGNIEVDAPVEHLHGAATRVPVATTACTLRASGFNVVIVWQWRTAAETERGVGWARDAFSALRPCLASNRQLNCLEEDAVDAATVAYGPNLRRRLQELKATSDPGTFVGRNVNILPRSGDAM